MGGMGGGGGGGTSGSGGTAGTSGAGGRPDASIRDGAMPDAATGLCITDGQRICLTPVQSGHCELLGVLMPVADRDCPPGSLCVGGYCQPPAGANSCTSIADCTNNQVCNLYSNPMHDGLVGY